MPAFILVDVDIHDPATYQRYITLAPPSIAAYGGTYLVRGATTTTLEGKWDPGRFVILQFPTADVARAWHGSPEYAEAKALRQSCASANMMLVEGPSFDPAAPPSTAV